MINHHHTFQKFIRTEDREGRGSIATKSVGAQFSSQLHQLRTRIDFTVPHYIRCLKPNDELIPDHFDPKMIVDQLRCGGVLEAVRVSRAGYPTRYPHDVFRARYYVLGEKKVNKSKNKNSGMMSENAGIKPESPYANKKRGSMNAADEEVKRLVSKIAFDIWEADHEAMMMALEEEQTPIADRSRTNSEEDSRRTRPNDSTTPRYLTGPGSLAAVSKSFTPEEDRKKKAKARAIRESESYYKNAISNTLNSNNNDNNDTTNNNNNSNTSSDGSKSNSGDSSTNKRPTSAREFLSLSFSSRCAIAGLQLGRTKVFLRREAFDRIEALRASKFSCSAAVIQKRIRGIQAREFCAMKRYCVLVIQRGARLYLRKCEIRRVEKREWAVVAIQRMYRRHLERLFHLEMEGRLIPAAIKIQSLARGANTRMWYFGTLYSVMRLQAVVRGYQARMLVGRMMAEKMAPVESPKNEDSFDGLNSFGEGREGGETGEPSPSKPSHFDECQAAMSLESSKVKSSSPTNMRDSGSTTDLSVVLNASSPSNYVTNLDPNNNTSLVPSSPSLVPSWTELLTLLHAQNWSSLESLLDSSPHLASFVDPTNGEMLLHAISRHPTAWTLLVDMILCLHPKALIHKDNIGALPMHHAAAHDNIAALEILHSAYKEGANEVDGRGRQPIHVAAEFDAEESVKFLLAKAPEGAYTMVHRPRGGIKTCKRESGAESGAESGGGDLEEEEDGGGLPLHIACRHHSSMPILTSLLAENFSSAKRADENGDLPLHLLLRNGEEVDQVAVKTLLTCFSSAVSRTDKNGDLPLHIAIKSECKPSVVNYLTVQYPEAAKVLDGRGRSTLHLALEKSGDDRCMLGLLNHAPELATLVDKESGLLPIQIATLHEHSHFIVHHLLKTDLPISLKEKVTARTVPHKYSWNHVVSDTDDAYFPVVNKILQQCTQPQVLALAHVEGPDGRIALATATPICKHEMRVMLRLFNTLEVVNQRPAFANPESDTQIFYALRYDPPKNDNGQWSLIHQDNKKENDYFDEWDDASHASNLSRISAGSNLSHLSHLSRNSLSSKCSQATIEERLSQIKKEKGQQVIAKLTSRSSVVERELKVRKDHHLSRHYVPAVISVHHTVQHAAYSEAMAEPGYCITMEGADTTAENLMLDMRRYDKSFSAKILKRIGISLLHVHERGLVHGDFGTHNVGKFGNRWKLLGVGGSVAIGNMTDPNRGFYHPPESIAVETKRVAYPQLGQLGNLGNLGQLPPFGGKKEISAKVISIPAHPAHDIWAYGVLLYEAICGMPLSPYACRGKRPMNVNEIAKIGKWDEVSLERALRHVQAGTNPHHRANTGATANDGNSTTTNSMVMTTTQSIIEDNHAIDILQRLLQPNPQKRYQTLREALEHPFFTGSSEDRILKKREGRESRESRGEGGTNNASAGRKDRDHRDSRSTYSRNTHSSFQSSGGGRPNTSSFQQARSTFQGGGGGGGIRHPTTSKKYDGAKNGTSLSEGLKFIDQENAMNGIPHRRGGGGASGVNGAAGAGIGGGAGVIGGIGGAGNVGGIGADVNITSGDSVKMAGGSGDSIHSHSTTKSFGRFKKGLRSRVKAGFSNRKQGI